MECLMATTKTSTVTKPKKQQLTKQAEKSALTALCVEYAPLQHKVNEHKRRAASLVKQCGELGDNIRVICDSTYPPDEKEALTVEADGEHYRIDIHEKMRRGKITSNEALIELIGLELF